MNATTQASPFGRKIAREIENAIDDVEALRSELARVQHALIDMRDRGLDAPQLRTPAGSGAPIDVDVRKMSELAGRCQAINLLREVEALS